MDSEEEEERIQEEAPTEEEAGSEEPGEFSDAEYPEMGRPSLAERAAIKAAALGERAGGAARGLLAGLGSKIESPAPPTDDLSDLFEGPDMDRDNDVYIKDLVTVDEEDVFGEGGEDMSDILEVTDEDVMGTEDWLGYGEGKPSTPPTRRPFLRVVSPPTGLAGVR